MINGIECIRATFRKTSSSVTENKFAKAHHLATNKMSKWLKREKIGVGEREGKPHLSVEIENINLFTVGINDFWWSFYSPKRDFVSTVWWVECEGLGGVAGEEFGFPFHCRRTVVVLVWASYSVCLVTILEKLLFHFNWFYLKLLLIVCFVLL